MISYLIVISISALLMIIALPIVRELAIRLGLVDKPNLARKSHAEAVPLIGGILIYMTTVSCLILGKPILEIDNQHWLIFGLATFLLFLGVMDDRFDVRASYKLCIQICCAILLYLNGISIASLHGAFGVFALTPILDLALTLLVVVGVTNACNLIDGIDGLAGAFFVLAFAWLAYLFYEQGYLSNAMISLSLVSGLMLFLKYNISPKKKIFLGDGGTLFLGFILISFSIQYLSKYNVDAVLNWKMVSVPSILLIPVLDSARVYLFRLFNGKSPFKADRTHLHHLLIGLCANPVDCVKWILGLVVLHFVLFESMCHISSIEWATVSAILFFALNIWCLIQVEQYRKSNNIIEAMDR